MPAIELYNSSNMFIQNCSIRNSVTQAIALSEMSGNVTINGCKLFKNFFRGHGAAIHYLSKIKHHSKFQFTISNSIFTHNGAYNSIVYISPSSNKSMEQVHLRDCVFLSNRGIPLYISHQNVFTNRIVLFKKNSEMSRGGGIFITNHSSIVYKNYQ